MRSWVDDLKCSKLVKKANFSQIQRVHSKLCIHDISLWMTSNSLKLNSDKTEFFLAISQHNKLRMPPVSLTIGNEVIQPSETVRNLGVIFDTHMTMSSQVSSLCRSVSYHLRNISRIRRFLDYNICNDIVRSLVLSRFDYGNVLLMGANAKQIARLQVLQNWAAKLIFCVAKKDHASPHFETTALATHNGTCLL